MYPLTPSSTTKSSFCKRPRTILLYCSSVTLSYNATSSSACTTRDCSSIGFHTIYYLYLLTALPHQLPALERLLPDAPTSTPRLTCSFPIPRCAYRSSLGY